MRVGLPYTLSTVASRTPEDVGPHLDGNGWFQLYTPRDPDIRADMLARVRAAGFGVLVLTADVPAASRRERQTRGGMTNPPSLTPRLVWQVARRPAWAWGTLRLGLPRMRLIDSYAGELAKGPLSSTAHVGYMLRTSPDWDYFRALRDMWDGPLVVKGVLRADDAARLADEGADAIWVSNHAGRQFDAAPATAAVLPEIRKATTLPILADGGVEGGLDVLRMLALGADFVMLGRAWHYALAALGARGPDHLADILARDMVSNMHQIGCGTLDEVRGALRDG
jgi:L-lactate dehydrogenase (cytochrome)